MDSNELFYGRLVVIHLQITHPGQIHRLSGGLAADGILSLGNVQCLNCFLIFFARF